MASSYTANNNFEKPAHGDDLNSWDQFLNNNFDVIDQAIDGVAAITLNATTLTITSPGTSQTGTAHCKVLAFTGSPSGTATVTISPNTLQKHYFIVNNTGQDIVFTTGSGATATVSAFQVYGIIYLDGSGNVKLGTEFGGGVQAITLNSTSVTQALTKGTQVLALSGTPGGAASLTLTPANIAQSFWVANGTNQAVTIHCGAGSTATIAVGQKTAIYVDGAGNVTDVLGAAVTVGGQLTAGSIVNSGTLSNTGAATLSGGATISGATALNGATTLGSSLNLNGQIISGNGNFTGNNSFSGATTFSGTTTLNGTLVDSGNHNFSGTTTFTGPTNLNGTNTLGAALNLNGQTLSGNGTFSGTTTFSGSVAFGNGYTNYSPTISAVGGGTVSNVVVALAYYLRIGQMIHFSVQASFTVGPAPAPTIISVSIPTTAVSAHAYSLYLVQIGGTGGPVLAGAKDGGSGVAYLVSGYAPQTDYDFILTGCYRAV